MNATATGTTTSNLLDGAIITISSNTSSVNLSSLSTSIYDGVLPYTIVTINSGISVIGNTGSNGRNGTYNYTHLWNGGSGGSGYTPFDFSGYSGYTVKIINNGTIKGGNGGRGGNGVYHNWNQGCDYRVTNGGSGGAGASWKKNDTGVTLEIFGIPPTNGLSGERGSNNFVKDGGWCHG